MRIQTILNRVEKFKPFVVGGASLEEHDDGPALVVQMKPRKNGRVFCSGCGRPGPAYDRLEERRFEFVPIWGILVFLAYRMRRVNCKRCGVTVEMVPWCDGKNRLTTTYRWYLATWAKRLSWSEVGSIFRTSWDSVWRAVEHAVEWGLAHRDLSGLTALGVDEIAWARGHTYLTLVYDIGGGTKRLLAVAEERTEASLRSCLKSLGEPACLGVKPFTAQIACSRPVDYNGGMDRPTSIPQHIWDTFSDEARAIVGTVIDGLERQIIELRQQVQDLKARLDQNSTNSSRPPSTDPIGVKRKPPEPPSRKRRGGQKGHPRRMRALVPPERVASVTDCKPAECRRCGHPLSGEDAEPKRHQVAELPPIEPEVHEYRLHRLCCPHCQTVSRGALPEGVPRTAFGPRLHATLSVLTGAYRLSKRQVAQLCSDLLGLTISLGMIAKLERITADVLEHPVAELAEQVKTAEAANIDETGWRESGRKAWLWVVVTAVGVVFRVARSRAGAVARDLLGEQPRPIVISDRFPGYEWIELKSRQICWAHLRRDMQAMIDRDGDGAEVGRQLLWQSGKLFESWHKARDGTIRRTTFLQTVAWLRPMVRSTLERGAACACPKTATTCAELLRLWDCLWTFTRVDGVEPTNNAAERALRHAVIWRRISGGTDSEVGSRFVERMLSVMATCRQQGHGVLDYLTRCHQARLDRRQPPSLLPASSTAQAA